MAWDSKASSSTAGQRPSNAASGTGGVAAHAGQQSKTGQPVQPQSPHVADPFLHDFLGPSFDAAAYLNAALPPLQLPGHARPAGAVPLSELSVHAQSVLSQLQAHTTRLTSILTELTNDILRSGGRLAYQVELLRGETLSLVEALSDRLEADIAKFAPPEGSAPPAAAEAAVPPDEPSYITQLRTLALVRSRLESVIKTFGDAMEFAFPPSEVSVGSSFLSVSAPDAAGESHSTEEKGRQVLQSLRDEVSRLLANVQDPLKGIEDAARRVEELKELVTVWKGTAEEKGRAKFVDSLAKMVEDRHRDLLRELDQSNRRDGPKPEAAAAAAATSRKVSPDADAAQSENKGYGAYGLISQFQKLRSGL